MDAPIDRLKELDNLKLVDIVKNYKQYGYSKELREQVMGLLRDRGFTREDLGLMGGFEHTTYDEAKEHYEAYNRNSAIALGFYIYAVIARIILKVDTQHVQLFLSVTSICAIIVFLVSIVRAFLNEQVFYKVTGEKQDMGGVFFILFGIPFYIFMYFYFRGIMKARMNSL
jgi:hypothetical protein